MRAEEYIQKYESFIFEFDDVLYPEKDYLLQVYYLFAQFMEYAELRDSSVILDFMKTSFDADGHEGIFERTQKQFDLDEKYRVNFDLLMQNVRLPLKLLLFEEMRQFLQAVAANGKKVFLLASGDPVMQLNKIRQTEWNGIETSLTVYFAEEFGDSSTENNILTILDKHDLKLQEALFVGHSNQAILITPASGITYLDATKLLA
jgi:RNAse (barnase) inhibitor barstar